MACRARWSTGTWRSVADGRARTRAKKSARSSAGSPGGMGSCGAAAGLPARAGGSWSPATGSRGGSVEWHRGHRRHAVALSEPHSAQAPRSSPRSTSQACSERTCPAWHRVRCPTKYRAGPRVEKPVHKGHRSRGGGGGAKPTGGGSAPAGASPSWGASSTPASPATSPRTAAGDICSPPAMAAAPEPTGVSIPASSSSSAAGGMPPPAAGASGGPGCRASPTRIPASPHCHVTGRCITSTVRTPSAAHEPA